MTAVGLPLNATYTDHGDGTATFDFNPDYTQANVYNVTFIASDGTMADTEIVAITVTNVDRAPVLATIGAKGVNEGSNLNFIATATDPDGQTPVMTAVGLPLNATYTDHGDGTATFDFNPDFTQANVYNVTFIASDGTMADTEIVAITVTENNRPPVLATIGAQGVNEGSNLNFIATATDPDGQTPVMTAVGLPLNATYTDHGDGTATFDFNPDYTQASVYNVTFIASDGTMADTEIVAITVTENNRPPVLATIGRKGVNEGSNLNFIATATDPDGQTPVMTAVGLPLNATYTDHGDGTATFDFNPDFTQASVYNVTFIASDVNNGGY